MPSSELIATLFQSLSSSFTPNRVNTVGSIICSPALGHTKAIHCQWPEPRRGSAQSPPVAFCLHKIQILFCDLQDLTAQGSVRFGNVTTTLQSAHTIPATLLWPIKVDSLSRTLVPTVPSSWRTLPPDLVAYFLPWFSQAVFLNSLLFSRTAIISMWNGTFLVPRILVLFCDSVPDTW